MANYLGYGLTAGVEGFKSGFGMAQQKTEMEWQKKQRKKLEEQELKLEAEAASYNMIVKQLGADGFYSEDDIMKINTTYLAFGYLTQERIKASHDAIMSMDKEAFDREMEWFNSTTEFLGSGLLDPKDATAFLEYGRNNWATSEKVQNLYTAYDNVYAKTHGKLQEEKAWEQVGKLPSEYRVPYLEEKGIGMPEPEVTPEAPTELSVAERKYNWAIEHYNLPEGDPNKISFEQLSRFMGIADITPEKATGLKKTIQDIQTQGAAAGISQEEINTAVKNKILGKPTPELEPKPETVSTLKNWEAMFDINAEEGPRTEEEYKRVLELLAQSKDEYKPKYPTWKEALVAEVKGIGRELEGITDKEDYNLLLNIYMQKLEEIKTKYPEVDLAQFPEFEEQKNWFDKLKERVGL